MPVHAPGQVVEHGDGRRAGEGDDDPGQEKILGVADDRAGRQGAEHVGYSGKHGAERVERQRRPVEKVRVQVAAHDHLRVHDRIGLVGPGAQVGQAEPDGTEPEAGAEQQDPGKPAPV
jgi:hypothetical protein